MRRIYSLALTTSVFVASPAFAQTVAAPTLTPCCTVPASTSEVATQEHAGTGQGSDAAMPKIELPAAPAAEPKTTVTFYANVKTAYVLNSIGRYAYDKPVVQSGVTVNFKNGLWVDLWNSTPLSFKQRDLNSYAEETDVTVGYAHKLGRFELSATVAYFALQPYRTTRDDVVQITAQAALPIKVGRVTIKPYVQPYIWLGTPDLPTQTFVRFGLVPSVTISGWSLALDAAREQKLTRGPKAITPEHGVFRFEASASRDLGHGWRFQTSLAKSGALPVVFSGGFSFRP